MSARTAIVLPGPRPRTMPTTPVSATPFANVGAQLAQHLSGQGGGAVLLVRQLRPGVNRAPPFDDALMVLPRQALELGAEVVAHRSSRVVDLPLTRRSDLCMSTDGGSAFSSSVRPALADRPAGPAERRETVAAPLLDHSALTRT